MVKSQDGERGQAIVLVALALVALLIIAGLAIDGGVVFLERRRMQNAADAAALAGTRELSAAMCGNESASAADAAVYATVVDYAQRNGVEVASDLRATYVRFDGNSVVEFSPPELVGGGAVPNGAVGVAVTSAITRPTSLVSLAGIDKTQASAGALAVTGPPLTGGGLRPYGVPDELVDALSPGDSFSISFQREEIVWATGASQLRGWLNMEHVWNTMPALNEQAQGWPRVTDLCTQGASCKKYLDEWMEFGWDGTLYGGDYIHSLPGATTSKVCTAPEDELFYVPIYDENGGYDCDDIPNPKPACPKAGGYCYHIVGFVGVKITECKKAPEKEITMELVETIKGEGVPSPNAGFGSNVCAMHTMVVVLVQ